MVTQLPLFPLGGVLFPGLVMPLHIFESRYRTLVEALMALPDGADREFGVVALRAGSEVGENNAHTLHTVGCTATLREVTPYADGRFDIVTVGRTRFRVDSIDDGAGTPYLTAAVELLPEPDGEADLARERDRVVRLFTRYRELVGGRTIAMPSDGPDQEDAEPQQGEAALPDDPNVVSYLVAAATTLDLATRQALLELPTTTERLRREAQLLRREIGLIRALPSLPDTTVHARTITLN